MNREQTSLVTVLGHDDNLETSYRVRDMQDDTEKEHSAMELPADMQDMHNLIVDASTEARVASTLYAIMDEFYRDGEPFQPREDAELLLWLDEVIARSHPEYHEMDRALLLRELKGFPPVERTQDDYSKAA